MDEPENYVVLGRLLVTFDLGLSKAMGLESATCTTKSFNNLRGFVKENRIYESVLMNPWIQANCLRVLAIDWRQSLFDRSLIALPRLFCPSKARQFFSTMLNIDVLDRDGLWRIRSDWMIRMSEETLSPHKTKFLRIPLHRVLTTHNFPHGQGGYLASLLAEAYRNNPYNIALGAQALIFYVLSNDLVGLREQIRPKVEFMERLVSWMELGDKPKVPDVYRKDSPFELLHLGVLLHIFYQIRLADERLIEIIQERASSMMCHEFLDLVVTITEAADPVAQCALWLGDSRRRILSLGTKGVVDGRRLMACLTQEESIEHLRRWQRKPSHLLNHSGSVKGMIATLMEKIVAMPPPLTHGRPTQQVLEEYLTHWINHPGIDVVEQHNEGDKILLLPNSSCPTSKMGILELVISAIVILLVHYDSFYTLDAGWVRFTVCIMDFGLDSRIKTALLIAFNICCHEEV
jgi:hypothetical protein